MDRHSVIRDALIGGVLGATAVALWFLGLDLAAGQPLGTPAALGAALLGVFGPPGNEGALVHVLAYTVFHYVAFIIVALIASVIVHIAERTPSVLAGAMILFVAFEIGFAVVTSILAHYAGFQGNLSWAAVGVGNLIAAIVMGVYLWRAHPAIGRELSLALEGRDDG
jgi:hypothetical protein